MSRAAELGEWLALAAAPTFAAMALATAVAGGDAAASLCGSAWPANGMALMYLLMAGFHLSPG